MRRPSSLYMDENRRTDFLRKFAKSLHSEDEHTEFMSWVRSASPEELGSAMETYRDIADRNPEVSSPDPLLIARLEARLDAVDARTPKTAHIISIWYKLVAAAMVVAVLSAGLYFYNNKAQVQSEFAKKHQAEPADALPGSNIAILTLADGSRISLDDAVNGEIAQQAGIHVTKTADGQLEYRISSLSAAAGTKNLYNTISTPRGGQYRINLPDGSKVWLNAASSLKYPVTFEGDERKVELTGEAYFEIAHNKSKPFRVESRNQVVEVFGTEFNINSYSNEPVIKTTLLNGSVKVTQTQNMSSKFLQPGQESINNAAGNLTVGPADVTQAVSWKNGNFLFNDMDLVNILRQLERWYDVDVDYSNMPETHYNGNISRKVNLSRVLKMLEVTGPVKFKIEGKVVRISK